MDQNRLITMANQIAGFFEPYSEDEAIEGVEQHIKSFWEPRMREQLQAVLTDHPDSLLPVVRKAAARLA